MMKHNPSEKGQALIIFALAASVLFAFAALAIDGGMVLSDRRHAQNAADTAALAGALAHARNSDITAAAQTRATSNGYDDGATNDVMVSTVDSPSGVCPALTGGKDVTVTIVSTVDTTFARVFGRNQVTNVVTATARACGSYTGPPFDGYALVALAPSGKAYDGTGTPDWNITGGGIYSNSSSSNAAYCNGDADITVPSVMVVGNTDFNCHSVSISGDTTTGASQFTYASVSALFPRQPACDGDATFSSGQWHPQSGADGSRVSWTGDADFAPGLYCVTNSPGPFHGQISGINVTFYIMSSNFSMTFNGGGNLTASAPTSGEYDGVLVYMAPQVDGSGNLLNTQELDMRGNGLGDVIGTILAPSASVTMFGNSGSGAFNTQVIAYGIDSGGNANINVSYEPDENYQAALPITLTTLK